MEYMSDELPTTPKRSRKGIIVLAILSLPALVFLVLAISSGLKVTPGKIGLMI